MRLALFTTHPIQYQAPWFRALAARGGVDLTVYFHTIPDARAQGEGFGVAFEWDVPLLDGYEWRVLDDRSGVAPSTHRFRSVLSATHAVSCDAVLITGWQSRYLIVATLAAALHRRPLLLRCEASALRPQTQASRIAHAGYLRLFDAFLPIGHANATYYAKHGADATRFFPAPYFVDNARFTRDAVALAPRRDELRRAWGIRADAVCFLVSGKLVSKKRPLDTIAAFAALGDDRPVHLLVVGDGELAPAVRDATAHVQHPVTLAGFLNQSRIAEAYTAADALVLPSDYGETWGLVVNEAMLFGLPAIVSDRVGCGPDLVREGETGFRVPFGDVPAITAAMRRLLDDHARRIMGDAARRRVLERYTVEATARGTLDAVHAVAGGRA